MLICVFLMALIAQPVELVPAPQRIHVDENGVFEIAMDTPIVLADGVSDQELAGVQLLFDALGHRLPITFASRVDADARAIFIGEPGRHASMDKRALRRLISRLDDVGPEGYRLIIERNRVVVAGSDPAGTLHGIETLAQLAKSGSQWPCLEIRDEPDYAMRGIILSQRPDPEIIQRLTKLKANLVVFDSPDFQALTPSSTAFWQGTFDAARTLHIEPVPMFRTLGGAQALIAAHPDLSETAIASDRIVLNGEQMVALSQRKIVDTSEAPVRVTVSGVACRAGADYVIDSESVPGLGALPWTIRRVPGGAIPDGASVDVQYLYRPQNAEAVSFAAPNAARQLRSAVSRVTAALQPKYLHIAHDDATMLARDGWARRAGKPLPQLYADSIAMLDDAAKAGFRETRLILWADGLIDLVGEDAAYAQLPDDLVFAMRGETPDETIEHLPHLLTDGYDIIGAPITTIASACAWTPLRGKEPARWQGVLVSPSIDDWNIASIALNRAWSSSTPTSAWVEGLNAFFGVDYWHPSPQEVTDAIIHYVNLHTLQGESPDDGIQAFRSHVSEFRERLPENDPDLAQTEAIYKNVAEYLNLYSRFKTQSSTQISGRLARLVEDYAALRTDWPAERVERINEIVRGQNLFVPSTILFGTFVLPTARMKLPEGAVLLTYPGEPEYAFNDGKGVATFTGINGVGPIARIDYESARAANFEVMRAGADGSFQSAGQWPAEDAGQSGPLVLAQPVLAQALRVSASGTGDQTVLRNVQIHAIKPRPEAVCVAMPATPNLDGVVETGAWRGTANASFVRAGSASLAQAQTTVQWGWNRTTLFIAIDAFEPRMATMETAFDTRDAPLWRSESLEVRIQPASGEMFRFIVNPLGAQFDSHNGDVLWDADWRAAVRTNPAGWSLEMALPIAMFESPIRAGASWQVNVIRNRANVLREKSAWTCSPDGKGSERILAPLMFTQEVQLSAIQ